MCVCVCVCGGETLSNVQHTCWVIRAHCYLCVIYKKKKCVDSIMNRLEARLPKNFGLIPNKDIGILFFQSVQTEFQASHNFCSV